MGEKLLEIKNLSVEYHTDDDDVFAVDVYKRQGRGRRQRSVYTAFVSRQLQRV